MSEYETEFPILMELLRKSPEGLSVSEVATISFKKPAIGNRYSFKNLYKHLQGWLERFEECSIVYSTIDRVDHSKNVYWRHKEWNKKDKGKPTKHYILKGDLRSKPTEEIINIFVHTKLTQ